MNGRSEQFPPEADGEFDVVAQEELDVWREKLNARFSIGQGQFRSLDVPQAS
jgi:hypothetical protein